MNRIEEILRRRDLLEATVHVFRRIHGFRSELVPAPEALRELTQKGVLREDCEGFTDSFTSRGGYACYEWYRQIFSPDCWTKHLEKVNVTDKRVLDVGCGPGATIAWCVRSKAHYVKGVDVDKEALALASTLLKDEPRAELCFGDAHALPDPDESFDVVICRVSLNYMRHEEAIQEFSRLLKPGGILYLVVHRFWYYISMLGGTKSRFRYGLTGSQLLRATCLVKLRMIELWRPALFSYYLAGVFQKETPSLARL